MNIEEKILNENQFNEESINNYLISICGVADLGKTYLSLNLVDKFNSIGIKTTHLPLDSFLMKRSVRIKNGIGSTPF